MKATHNLAVLLAGRGGATPDYPQAAKLFSEFAAHGLTDSQFNLAMLYESGLGVPRDLKEAYKWLLLASRSGDKEAASQRDALKLQLSDADRATAEAAAKTFRAKAVNPVANDFRATGPPALAPRCEQLCPSGLEDQKHARQSNAARPRGGAALLVSFSLSAIRWGSLPPVLP